jgi:cytochrome c-type biogenesis protein CcmH/NrfG
MLRLLITVVIVVAAFSLVRRMTNYYGDVKSKQNDGRAVREQPAAPAPNEPLAGLPAQFEGSLQSAQNLGPVAMKRWLDSYAKYVADPRLAQIELDYVQMISRENPAEARRLFAEVRRRLPAASPLQSRIKEMVPTYQ